MKKLHLWLLAALTALPLALASCTGDTPGEDTDVDSEPAETSAPAPQDIALVTGGVTEYIIVRGDNSSSVETAAAVFLRKYMEKCGLKVKITTDWEGNGKSEREIVVGDTLRTAEDGNTFDAHSVGSEGYFARVSGTRIYLGGGSDASVQLAVEAFLTKFFGYAGDPNTASPVTDVTVPGTYEETVRQQFDITSLTLGGKNLGEYKFVVDTKDTKARSAATTMRDRIYALCGVWIDVADRDETWDGPAIRLTSDKPSKSGCFEASVSGTDLVLKTDVMNGFARGFSQMFADIFADKTGEIALAANYSFSADIGSYTTYSEFGAVGDGKTNDIAAIIATHAYANSAGIEVRADEGAVYYISAASEGAIIQTNTDWTGASFIIDDSGVDVANRNVNIFTVKSKKAQYTLSTLKAPLKRGQENLGITLAEPAIVVINDATTKRYIREGANQNSGSDQTDIVLVDKDGNIDMNAPLIWDYDSITSAYAIPVDEEVLTIKGGTFTTVANQAESAYNYYGRGININRSNVVVDGLVHYVEGELDHGAPYSGIIQINNCANVTVQNCLFTAHKIYATIGSAGRSVNMGSYDISPSRVVNLTFKNCKQTTDILDEKYWGIMGSNFCKNIVLDGCEFSRFDAHQGVANVTILNSTLGWQCLNAIGTGTLLVENTTLYGDHLITLRSDYGSTWEGDVVIKDCTWIPNQGKGVGTTQSVIGGSFSGFHDFGYDCYMPHTITIEGLHVDDKKRSGGYQGVYLLADFVSQWRSEAYEKKVAEMGYPYYVTETINISGFTSESGKTWRLSPNTYMFRNVVINDGDAAK